MPPRFGYQTAVAHPVRVGNVYKSSASGPRGKNGGTRFWLVIGITGEWPGSTGGAHLLGLDRHWNIVSTCSYGIWVMERRPFLYRVKNVEAFANMLKGEQK